MRTVDHFVKKLLKYYKRISTTVYMYIRFCFIIYKWSLIMALILLLFLTGNLGRVDYITEHEYDLFVRPDTCNPRFRVWFNFTVENNKADQVSLILQFFKYNLFYPKLSKSKIKIWNDIQRAGLLTVVSTIYDKLWKLICYDFNLI